MKPLRGLAALLALLAQGQILLAQDYSVSGSGPDEVEHPRWIESGCMGEPDEETQAQIDRIDEKTAFFDRNAFDCDEDWFSAEAGDAPVLRLIGQPSYRDNKPSKKSETWHLRRVGLGSGVTTVVAIDCSFALDEYGQRDSPIGGKVTRYSDNPYTKEKQDLRELRLGKADCALFEGMLDNVKPDSIVFGSMTNGDIIVDGGLFLTELNQGDGFSTIYTSYSGQMVDPNNRDAQQASEAIDLLFSYFSARVKEAGRRVDD